MRRNNITAPYALFSLAAICIATPLSLLSAQEDAAKVERYLSRLGLSELRVRLLEREVQQGGESKDKAARKLADAYAQALMDAAEDQPRFDRLKQQIDKLLLASPAASTPALQVGLLQAEFQRGEALVSAWMEDPKDHQALVRAADILGPLAKELEEKGKYLSAAMDRMSETMDAIKGEDARRTAEHELLRQQAVVARVTYYTGWCRYYLGVTKREPKSAEPDFTAAKAAFCEVLGVDGEKEYQEVEDVASLGLESTWRARTALGLALAEEGLGRQAAADRCFSWLQHASAPAGLRDQGGYWQLQGLLNAPNLASAAEYAKKKVETLSSPPTPGKNSLCIAAIRAGAAVDPTSADAETARNLIAAGIRGLARLRQFETLSQLVAKHKLEELQGKSASFYLSWLKGRTQFFAAEKTKAAADYQSAAVALSAALDLPEAARDLFAAAQCRYHLAWCKFRLDEFELAARLFHEASPVLVEGEKELAVQAAWMEFASFQKLAETKKDKKYAASAVAALQTLKRDFPDSEQAGKAELLIPRLQQDVSPEQALASLVAIKPTEPNYPAARLEIAQLQFQNWTKLKGDKARAPAAEAALAAVDTLLAAKGASGDQKLRGCLIGLQVVFDTAPVDEKRAASLLETATPVGEALPAQSPLAAEFHYRQLQFAQKTGEKKAMNKAAAWIAANGAGSPYETPALVIVARQADDAVAGATDANRKDLQIEAAEIYTRLAALVGESSEAIAGVKNALAVNSKLAHYDESLGHWQEAAARLDKIVAAMPSDKKYLRRAGLAHFQAGEYAPSLEQWRKLLGGVESGSEEWLEAKYHQLACLAKTDRPNAVKVWKQFKLLFPQVKSPTWKDKFAALEADLGK